MELMRYREEEYWSSSGDREDESSEEESNSINSIGRGYECVYCKRGFTTAQALGGHMNIHRKDRSKPKPKPSNITSTSTSTNHHLGLSFYNNSPIIHPPPPRGGGGGGNIINNYFFPPPSATHQDHRVVDVDLDYTNTNTNNHQFYYCNPAPTCTPPTHASTSFYSNNNHPFCVPLPPMDPHNLDLELRLGYHP